MISWFGDQTHKSVPGQGSGMIMRTPNVIQKSARGGYPIQLPVPTPLKEIYVRCRVG